MIPSNNVKTYQRQHIIEHNFKTNSKPNNGASLWQQQQPGMKRSVPLRGTGKALNPGMKSHKMSQH